MPFDGMKQGGIFPALVGPCAYVGNGLGGHPHRGRRNHLSAEYARDTWVTRCHPAGHRQSAGIPSIVYGLFGWQFVLVSQDGTSILPGL